MEVLAPWYDLNESSRVFGAIVPLHALHCPVLFKALIAFAATHRHKISGESQEIATSFHAGCVRENIAFADDVEGFSLEDRVLEWQSLDARSQDLEGKFAREFRSLFHSQHSRERLSVFVDATPLAR